MSKVRLMISPSTEDKRWGYRKATRYSITIQQQQNTRDEAKLKKEMERNRSH